MASARCRLTEQRSSWGWASALLCVVLAVAGCAAQHPSASRTGHSSQTGHKRAEPNASPSAAGQTTKQLAAAYLAIALPANRRLDKEVDSYEDHEHDDLAIARRDLRAEAATERGFDSKLLKIAFPIDVKAIAWELVQANNERIALTERQSRAATTATLREFDKRHKTADAAVEGEVRIIRKDLGLPPPDND
jgi:hypothetical protein